MCLKPQKIVSDLQFLRGGGEKKHDDEPIEKTRIVKNPTKNISKRCGFL
jgi:hypothetical protein